MCVLMYQNHTKNQSTKINPPIHHSIFHKNFPPLNPPTTQFPEEFERNHETTCNFKFKIKRSNQITKNRKKMSKDDEEVLLDYNEEDDAVQEPTKEKEVKASK